MTKQTYVVADAIREVVLAMQRAIDTGHRARMTDADDLAEILLSVADRLDPQVRHLPAKRNKRSKGRPGQ